MYDSYFGLRGQPFKLTPDTSYFFGEGQRKAILDALVYALKNGEGIVKLIGEVGTGKTFLSRMLEKALPQNFEFIFILNPNMPAEKILLAIARELRLDIPESGDKLAVLHVLQAKLLSLHANNRQVVVVIDEAQSMPLETLEEIRLLSNLETESHKLLQILLIGQPELDKHLNQHRIRQIKERITHSLYLPSLNQSEIYRYIDYRLRCAGYQGAPLFSKSGARLIALRSRGLLRRVNILSDKALLSAFSKGSQFVGVSDALKSIGDGGGQKNFWAQMSKVFLPLMLGFAVVSASNHWNVPEFWKLLPINNETVEGEVSALTQNAVIAPDFPSQSQISSVSESNSLEVRISETRRWIAQSSQLGYSIQLLQSYANDSRSLKKYIDETIPVSLIHETYVFPIQVGGRTLWSIYYGRFESYQHASNVLENMDQSLKTNQPFVVTMANIKTLYHQDES